ncbi:MAG: radical SAM protein [Deltaproteobacteria bacterium]|nr:radical SAM protein [Deltaproteobacteria bacterium]
MPILYLEITNQCNRQCLHCNANTADPRGSLPLELARDIFAQAKELSFKRISLTGGEVAVYPHLEDLVHLIVEKGFEFALVTNGFRFQERLCPLLLRPEVRSRLVSVGLSLDGARPESHDAVRGEGSFEEVLTAARRCGKEKIPFVLKTALTSFNRGESEGFARLRAFLAPNEQHFLYTLPTPRSLRNGVALSPHELEATLAQLGSYGQTNGSAASVAGFSRDEPILAACRSRQAFTVDFSGNLIFCCNLSRLNVGEGVPTTFGQEFLADLKEVPLKEGIKRHIYLAARLGEARINDLPHTGLNEIPCYWCLKFFGKLEWLKEFPDSPWAAGVLDR